MAQLLRLAPLRAWSTAPTERTDLEEAWHRHGAALFALTLVLFENAEDAESVVTQAFLDAFTPGDIALAPVTRRELARYVYVLWVRRTAAVQAMALSSPDRPSTVARMTTLSHRQRTAIALAMFGEHTYTEIAALMELPAPDIASMLRSGLLAAAAGTA